MALDRIEKKVVLQASLERVWKALSRAEEFGAWFGLRAEGEFRPNTTVQAVMVPTQSDPVIAEKQKAFEGQRFELYIEEMEPMKRFSFRWHPGAEPDVDAATTLVTFELEETEGGTLLTLTETGFDQIPLERRAQVFTDNEGGWEIQTRLIANHLARS